MSLNINVHILDTLQVSEIILCVVKECIGKADENQRYKQSKKEDFDVTRGPVQQESPHA